MTKERAEGDYDWRRSQNGMRDKSQAVLKSPGSWFGVFGASEATQYTYVGAVSRDSPPYLSSPNSIPLKGTFVRPRSNKSDFCFTWASGFITNLHSTNFGIVQNKDP